MTELKAKRLSKIAKEFNVGISTIVDYLEKKGVNIESNPNTKIQPSHYQLLQGEFSSDISAKEESNKLDLKSFRSKNESVSISDVNEEEPDESNDVGEEEVLIKDNRSSAVYEPEAEKEFIKSAEPKIKVLGKMDVDKKKPEPKEKAPEPEIEEKQPETKPEPEPESKVEAEPKVEAKKEAPVEEKPEAPIEKPVKKEPEQKKTPEAPVEKPVAEEKKKPEAPVEKPAAEESKVVVEKKEEKSAVNSEISHLKDHKIDSEVKVLGKIDLSTMNQRTRPAKKTKEEKDAERKARHVQKNKPKTEKNKDNREQNSGDNTYRSKVKKLSGPTVVGKMDIEDKKRKPVASSSDSNEADRKKKRKRIKKSPVSNNKNDVYSGKRTQTTDNRKGGKKRGPNSRPEVNEQDVQKQVKDTLARLTQKSKSKSVKHRRDKRDAVSQKMQEDLERAEKEKNVLKVTEFIPVSELANMMDVPVTDIISTCMNLGLFVSINQRLDAETMTFLADEYNYTIEFISVEVQESIAEETDDEKELVARPPIVTVMGHVDHGKTRLLDHVRSANVIAGEAGGITQHIGAYNVKLKDGREITFLDTPGHEAFTAMRARGAQLTDIAIIVVAADDGVKPQTVEAINHAHAAGVPIIFAINKIDKPAANPDKVKEELSAMNFLVEDWGGKYQSQEISAKNGINIEELLEKVLLEAEMLELKANPDKKAVGAVVESSLDKGRGFLSTVLVQAGTLKVGDVMLAGHYYGHVKAMFNERGNRVEEAGPSKPVLMLGLNGAPQAGDKFNVMEGDKEAKEIASKRSQLAREQEQRTQKHITLDEIGRRIAIGNFQELNVIVKGDVDGSVEALSDSLLKLSNEEIQVNIKHKAVGQISEADILLAAASNAIVIGFQVRPSAQARKLAEKEEIDIRLYSIIYDAIEEVKSAMEGMLSPEIREEIVGSAEIREAFKITKVGTIAGCMVMEGKIQRDNKVRVIRDGIVVYTGVLGSLKRFKDDAKEVVTGLECGLNVENFNDIKVGDIIEGFREIEVKKTL